MCRIFINIKKNSLAENICVLVYRVVLWDWKLLHLTGWISDGSQGIQNSVKNWLGDATNKLRPLLFWGEYLLEFKSDCTILLKLVIFFFKIILKKVVSNKICRTWKWRHILRHAHPGKAADSSSALKTLQKSRYANCLGSKSSSWNQGAQDYSCTWFIELNCFHVP